MRKYTSASLKEPTYWWNTLSRYLSKSELQRFNKFERRAAFLYEFSARVGGLDGGKKQINYPLKVAWPALKGFARFRIVETIRGINEAVLMYPIDAERNYVERNAESGKQHWSKEYRIRFDLNATPTMISEEVSLHFLALLESLSKSINHAGKLNAPISFRRIEEADKILCGEKLHPRVKSRFKSFREEESDFARRFHHIITTGGYSNRDLWPNACEDPINPHDYQIRLKEQKFSRDSWDYLRKVVL